MVDNVRSWVASEAMAQVHVRSRAILVALDLLRLLDFVELVMVQSSMESWPVVE